MPSLATLTIAHIVINGFWIPQAHLMELIEWDAAIRALCHALCLIMKHRGPCTYHYTTVKITVLMSWRWHGLLGSRRSIHSKRLCFVDFTTWDVTSVGYMAWETKTWHANQICYFSWTFSSFLSAERSKNKVRCWTMRSCTCVKVFLPLVAP